jgi:molecular chaperone DnaK (HSP70)
VSAKLNINSNNIILNNKNNLYKTIVADGATTLYELLNAKSEFCLLDIVPMNIGISSPNNQMILMIGKNSKIPISTERVFTTSHDCQRTIDIDIYEGTNVECDQNSWIGAYKIIGIPPLPRGSIIIKLLFKISYNGILNISINGFKNPSDDSAKSFDFKLCEKIKLIPSILAKELLRKLLSNKKSE